MHNQTLKKTALVLIIVLALRGSSLRAQTFTAPLQVSKGTPNPVDLEFRADGTLIAKGNANVGTLLSSDQGVGTRMLWYPALAAFRVGRIDTIRSNVWDLANIGKASVAFGLDTTASGVYSTASGGFSIASGNGATALGFYATATGDFSTALGSSHASGFGSTAFGYGTTASGYYSTASGYSATASGYASHAAGYYVSATGTSSTALGYASTATGAGSFASGECTIASGDMSTASGYRTTASAFASCAVGSRNVGGGNPNDWVATDPLFEVGNASPFDSVLTTSNALVVYKNGNAKFQGVVTAAPGGDIPMYTGN